MHKFCCRLLKLAPIIFAAILSILFIYGYHSYYMHATAGEFSVSAVMETELAEAELIDISEATISSSENTTGDLYPPR